MKASQDEEGDLILYLAEHPPIEITAVAIRANRHFLPQSCHL
jgi:hypothetical protein